jgi:hypothetical protein
MQFYFVWRSINAPTFLEDLRKQRTGVDMPQFWHRDDFLSGRGV